MFVCVRAAVGQFDADVFPLLPIGFGHTVANQPDWSTEAFSRSSSPFRTHLGHLSQADETVFGIISSEMCAAEVNL